MVLLQNHTDLEKGVRVPCTETCPVSSHDADHFVSVKVEDILDIKEEEVPVPVPCEAIKDECEVSCMFLHC
jgi:hypothetical protein